MTWSSLGWIMVQWVYPREGWFVCKEQKLIFFEDLPFCNLWHQSSLSKNIELNIITAACMTLIYQRRCGETFLKEQLKPIGVARLKPARQPLFRLFFLSSPCQPSTKSWSTIPKGESWSIYHTIPYRHLVSRLPKSWSSIPTRGESLTERNISQLWWILFSMCFQVKTCF